MFPVNIGLVCSKGTFNTNDLESGLLLSFLGDYAASESKTIIYRAEISADEEAICVPVLPFKKSLEECFEIETLYLKHLQTNASISLKAMLNNEEEILIFPYIHNDTLDSAYKLYLKFKLKEDKVHG